jgi:hypothetical protein
MVRARPALEAEVPTLLIISKKSAESVRAITADVIAQSAASAPRPKWRLRYMAAVTNAGTIRTSGMFALASLCNPSSHGVCGVGSTYGGQPTGESTTNSAQVTENPRR